jgi:NADH oxidase (H2O2-forming)
MFQLKHNAIEQGRVVARNILGDEVPYLGAYAFARAHFFDTHAVTFGKTMRETECLVGEKELVEKTEGSNYLRLVLVDGKILGGQAIGSFADSIGFFISAMWRKEDMNHLRARLHQMPFLRAARSWPQIRMGALLEQGSYK